ncbi:hypothetical protein [Xaviernesmea oryzae]|uniref:hypothetical protein n=1 Tax=Xaviernesmea oryzae TaxID=464029 RepID=UPI0008AD71F1|nr:hypothetical protein [Xaviernesmea oryzae]SEK87978.1 hypothetical protein SAMN04487976_104268 [Xaviernesmea oryzae]
METWPAVIALIISGMALAVSAITAWLTFFRIGKLRMTRPSLIFFGYDTTPGKPDPKVFLRGLLFSTSKRGQLIENLYVRLKRGEAAQNFSLWFHGDSNGLSVGGGLFVGSDGVATNHHFVLSSDQKHFSFQPGILSLEVFGNVVGKQTELLFKTELTLTSEHAEALSNIDCGLHFNWGPESRTYYAHIDRRPERLSSKELLALASRSEEFGARQGIMK